MVIKRQELYFWQTIVSPHQSSFLRSLASLTKFDVTLIVEKEISPSRLKMGLQIPDLTPVTLMVSPSKREILEILQKSEPRSVHVFSGPRGNEMIFYAFRKCVRLDRIMGIMSETYDRTGLKGKLRLLRGWYDKWSFGKRIDFILAIGSTGRAWYESLNYEQQKIFDWAYFVEESEKSAIVNIEPDDHTAFYNIVFVGSLLESKGLRDLIFAFSEVVRKGQKNVRLHLVGDGRYKVTLQELIRDRNIIDRVIFYGFLPNDTVRDFIHSCDLLVLPSQKKDGWGAVVNEALHQGVPVLVSDMCGSSILVANSTVGAGFQAGNITDLEEKLTTFIVKGRLSFREKNQVRLVANHLSGHSAARYFQLIYDFVTKEIVQKPKAPWS